MLIKLVVMFGSDSSIAQKKADFITKELHTDSTSGPPFSVGLATMSFTVILTN